MLPYLLLSDSVVIPTNEKIVAKLASSGEYSITRPVLQTIELQNDSGYMKDEEGCK